MRSGTTTIGGQIVPASLGDENIISVAAMTQGGAIASFSNYGRNSVDLVAPGTRILSTTPAGTTDFKSGTSMAAAHVSGVAALIWSVYPSADYTYVRDAILAGVRTTPALSEVVATSGQLKAAGAIQQVEDLIVQLTPRFFVPGHLRGDRDFAGHGPKLKFIAQARINSRGEIETRVFLSAEEWGKRPAFR